MAKLDLNKLKQLVENSADLTSEAREQSERDRDYYDGHQWTAEEISTLQRRKQPVITINRIKRKIDAMVGIEQRGRTDPKAYPRNPQDDEAANAATKALVYVDDNTRFDTKKSACFEDMLVSGYAGVEVVVEERRGKFEVAINRLRWEEVFFDPHSREKDFSDASYMGCMKWMSLDKALEMYEGAYTGKDDLSELLETTLKNTQEGETFDDRPQESRSFQWGDRRMKRVRVAQMYYQRGGTWYLAVFCGGGEILNDVSPYQDEDGQPTNPMQLFTGYIDRENRRYGVVRDMISAQDEINKRRSKLLHQLNSRQTVGVKGAVDSVSTMKRELAAPDGHVDVSIEAFEDAARVGMKPFDIIQNQDQTSGQFSLLTEAKGEIDMVGPNASLLGQLNGAQSGRAIQAQQQAGLSELSPIYDSLRDWNLRVYRAVWERIKQFWTEERWVRVADQRGVTEFIGLNVVQGMEPVHNIDGSIQLRPMVQNPVAEMDLDIIIEDAPDYETLRHEEFEQLAQMAQNGIPVPPEMIIEASNLTNKADLLQKLEEQKQQQMQMQMQTMQAQQQEQAQANAVKAQREQAATMKDMASADKLAAEVQETQADTAKTVVETQRLALGY